MHWLALLIPFVVAIVYKVKFDEDVNWLEFLGSLFLAVVIVFGSVLGYSYSIGQDKKMVSGYVVGKEYTPEHEITVCVPISCGEDCTTIQCHQQIIPDDYEVFIGRNKPDAFVRSEGSYGGEVVGRKGISIDVSKQFYNSLILGDTAVWTETFDNPLKRTKRSLYSEIKDNKYEYVHMPKIYSHYKADRLIELNDVNLPNVNARLAEINSALTGLNINLGIIVTTYPREFVKYQENYWLGGNPNDCVVVVGITEDRKLSYVETIAWGNEYLKVSLRGDILNKIKTIDELPQLLEIIYSDLVRCKFVPADFSKFDYLKVRLPTWMIAVVHIITLIGVMFFLEYCRNNETYN